MNSALILFLTLLSLTACAPNGGEGGVIAGDPVLSVETPGEDPSAYPILLGLGVLTSNEFEAGPGVKVDTEVSICPISYSIYLNDEGSSMIGPNPILNDGFYKVEPEGSPLNGAKVQVPLHEDPHVGSLRLEPRCFGKSLIIDTGSKVITSEDTHDILVDVHVDHDSGTVTLDILRSIRLFVRHVVKENSKTQ